MYNDDSSYYYYYYYYYYYFYYYYYPFYSWENINLCCLDGPPPLRLYYWRKKVQKLKQKQVRGE